MAKIKVPSVKQLEYLYEDYDKARTIAKEAEKDKKEAGDAIKSLLGDTVEASTPRYIVTYNYDKDTETEVFDETRFAENDTKGYMKYQKMLGEIETITKNYTKTVITKGARKLIVTAKEV